MAKFEVKARVLDLLGEQQIANCPTAISELFKNAYDAYARSASLDIFPDHDLAILSDDGVGMSEEELKTRWLVVAATGKTSLDSSVDPPKGMRARPIQGEKGIGRLAVAALGDTLLLISRSRVPGSSGPFAALLINWNLVRNQNLLLSQVDIPTLTFSTLDEFDGGILDAMAEQLREVLHSDPEAWSDRYSRVLADRILKQLKSFQIAPGPLRQALARISDHGSLFCIRHLGADFQAHLLPPGRYQGGDKRPNLELVQLLCNFRNPFEMDRLQQEDRSEREKGMLPEFAPDIRLWDEHGQSFRSVFQEHEAISAEDLRFHDHFFDIQFDKCGNWDGTIEIYGEPVEIQQPVDPKSRATACGPFRLRVWYYQGIPGESTLTRDQFSIIDKKLEHFGGLMIYRDGLRVLPYGVPEFDWLRFEERRSKGAGYYFFSYRRMFGFVDISRGRNPSLVDKAGREGLIQNGAYRELREILVSFFVDMAQRYFYRGDDFLERKKELKAAEANLRSEKKRIKERRDALYEEATVKLAVIREVSLDEIDQILESSLQELGAQHPPAGPAEVSEAIVRVENRLAQLQGHARLTVPRDVSLGRDRRLRQVLHDHGVAYRKFADSCADLRQQFTKELKARFPEAERSVDRRRLIENAEKQALARIGRVCKQLVDTLGEETARLRSQFEELCERHRDRAKEVLLTATGSASIEEARGAALEDLTELLSSLDSAVQLAESDVVENNQRVQAYLRSYFGAARDEVLAAQSDVIEELQEKVDQNLELVQLGLAVEIIDHDLNKLYRGIRANLSRLRTMVRNAPNASRQLEELRAGFQHIEQRYRLMSPLYRGSYRLRCEISGLWILTYCRDFLEYPLRVQGVTLEASDAFKELKIEEAPAVLFPVFVNLLDNAIYWLRDAAEKRIVFDRHGDVVTICDSGPGIHPALQADVFEPFYTTKPDGRGLGLYIARANLERSGHSIWISDDPVYRQLPGACICIRFAEEVWSQDN